MKEIAGSPKNLAQRLLAVMASIDAVAKSKHNDAQNYDYVTAADVARAVRQACITEGVMLTTSVVHAEVLAPIPTRSGGSMAVTRVILNITAANVDSPEDVIAFSVIGDGADTGDKGIYKAITGALKYGLRNLFLIPDAADPEGPSGEQPAQVAQVAQSPEFLAWMQTQLAAPAQPDEEQQAVRAATSEEGALEVARELAAQERINAIFAEDAAPAEKPKRTRAKAKTVPAKPIEGEQLTVEQATEINAELDALKKGATGDLLAPSDAKKSLIWARSHEKGLTEFQLKGMTTAITGKGSSKEWTDADADQIIALLENEPAVALFKALKETE